MRKFCRSILLASVLAPVVANAQVALGLVVAGVSRRPIDVCCTCKHVHYMSRMIQIRHVPDQLHRRLKVRAASSGMSLSDFLRLELERSASQLTADELRARLASLSMVPMDESAADAVRAEREAR